MGVLVIEIVFADVDDRQLPQLGQVHHLVEHALSQRSFPKEAHRNPIGAEPFCGKRGSGGDTHASCHNGVRSEIAGGRVGDVHGSTLAAAIARFLAQQLGKHPVRRSPFGQTMSVTAVRARNVIVRAEGLAYPDCHCFLADIKMCEAGHQCPRVQLIHLFFEQANAYHPAIHPDPLFD